MTIPHAPRGHNPSDGLTIHAADTEQTISADDLVAPEVADQLANLCTHQGVIQIHIRHILHWPDEARWNLLEALSEAPGGYRLRIDDEQMEYTDLFAFALSCVHDMRDVTLCERSRRLALEVAVLVHPDSLDIACESIASRFKDLGVRAVTSAKLLKLALQIQNDKASLLAEPAHAARAFVRLVERELGEDSLDLSPDPPPPLVRYYQDEFYFWRDARWCRISDQEVRLQLTAFIQEKRPRAATTKFVNDTILNVKALVNLDAWDEPMPFWIDADKPLDIGRPRLLALSNGLIDVDEMLGENGCLELYASSPRWFSTIRLDYSYNPNAGCRLWLETLATILPSTGPQDHRIDVLQEFMGLTLIPAELKYQKFLILVGGGSNGKSTILDTWQAMLGRENVSTVPLDRFDGEFRLIEMSEKPANIAGEMNHIDRVAEGVFKQLVTGDPIQANRKYKSMVTLVPTARLIFATNDLPSISDRTKGMWRRMIAMPFLVAIGSEDADIHRVARLRNELPGILNWAYEGAQRLSQAGRFTYCAVCEACASEHRVHCDPVQQFLDERVIFGDGLSMSKDFLYAAYRQYCEDCGFQAKSKPNFVKDLCRDARITPGRIRDGEYRQHVIRGIALDHANPQNLEFARTWPPTRPTSMNGRSQHGR